MLHVNLCVPAKSMPNYCLVSFFLLTSLSANQIAAVSGLEKLGQLSMLSLADNRLENISNLDHLPLKYLNLVSPTVYFPNLVVVILVNLMRLTYEAPYYE